MTSNSPSYFIINTNDKHPLELIDKEFNCSYHKLDSGSFKIIKQLIVNNKYYTDVIFNPYLIDTLDNDLNSHLITFVTYTNYDYVFLFYKTPTILNKYITNQYLCFKLFFPKNYADFRIINFLDFRFINSHDNKYNINNIIYVNIIVKYTIDANIDLVMVIIYYLFKLHQSENIFTDVKHINNKSIHGLKVSPFYSIDIYPNNKLEFPKDSNKFPQIIDFIHHTSHLYKKACYLDLKDENLGYVRDCFLTNNFSLLSNCDIDYYSTIYTPAQSPKADPFIILANYDIKHKILQITDNFDYTKNNNYSLDYINRDIINGNQINFDNLTFNFKVLQSNTFEENTTAINIYSKVRSITNENSQILDLKFLNLFYNIDLSTYEYTEFNSTNKINNIPFDLLNSINPYITDYIIYMIIECCNNDFLNSLTLMESRLEDNIFISMFKYIRNQIKMIYKKIYQNEYRKYFTSPNTYYRSFFYSLVNHFFIVSKKRIENSYYNTLPIEYLIGVIYNVYCETDKNTKLNPMKVYPINIINSKIETLKQKFKNLLSDLFNKDNLQKIINTKLTEVNAKMKDMLDFYIQSINFVIKNNELINIPIINYITTPLTTFMLIKKTILEENKTKIVNLNSKKTILEYIKIIEFFCFTFVVTIYGLSSYVLSFISDKNKEKTLKCYHLFKEATIGKQLLKNDNKFNYYIFEIKTLDMVNIKVFDEEYIIYLPKFELIGFIKFEGQDIKNENTQFQLRYLFLHSIPESSSPNIINSPYDFVSKTFYYRVYYHYQNTHSKLLFDDLFTYPQINIYLFKINMLRLNNSNYIFDNDKYASILSEIDKFTNDQILTLSNIQSITSNLLYHNIIKKCEFSIIEYDKYLNMLTDNIFDNKYNQYNIILISPNPRDIKKKDIINISKNAKDEFMRYIKSLQVVLTDMDGLDFNFIPNIQYIRRINNTDNCIFINALIGYSLELSNQSTFLIPFSKEKIIKNILEVN